MKLHIITFQGDYRISKKIALPREHETFLVFKPLEQNEGGFNTKTIPSP